MNNRLTVWSGRMTIALLGCLAASYYPVLLLGSHQGMHIDGSLLYLVAVVAVLVSLPLLWRQRILLWQSLPLRIFTGFAVYTTLSTLWSQNSLRAVATAGFLWLVLALSATVMANLEFLRDQKKPAKIALAAGLAVSFIWASWQILGDALGISPEFTLLPQMYRSDLFGVARPTALALEPQFFASLLLAPFGWFLYRVMRSSSNIDFFGLLITCCFLVLTLSRGGLLAAAVIAIILIASSFSAKKAALAGLAFVLGLALSLLIIASLAALNQRDSISAGSAVGRSLNHLSLGLIDAPRQPVTTAPKKTSQPSPNGYVESSTSSRIGMTEAGLTLWSSSPGSLLFGVGTGGFGAALHQQQPSQPVGSIVNNYYVEVLVELGVIGLVLFLLALLVLLYQLARQKHLLILAIVAGFMAQWYFFSGNANIIHVWVVLGIAMAYAILRRGRLLQ